MEITWEGGSRSSYTAEQLRWACPCAECRGEAGMPGRLARLQTLSPAEMRIHDVTLVGQYALQIALESGHATVIITLSHHNQLVHTFARPVVHTQYLPLHIHII